MRARLCVTMLDLSWRETSAAEGRALAWVEYEAGRRLATMRLVAAVDRPMLLRYSLYLAPLGAEVPRIGSVLLDASPERSPEPWTLCSMTVERRATVRRLLHLDIRAGAGPLQRQRAAL